MIKPLNGNKEVIVMFINESNTWAALVAQIVKTQAEHAPLIVEGDGTG